MSEKMLCAIVHFALLLLFPYFFMVVEKNFLADRVLSNTVFFPMFILSVINNTVLVLIYCIGDQYYYRHYCLL